MAIASMLTKSLIGKELYNKIMYEYSSLMASSKSASNINKEFRDVVYPFFDEMVTPAAGKKIAALARMLHDQAIATRKLAITLRELIERVDFSPFKRESDDPVGAEIYSKVAQAVKNIGIFASIEERTAQDYIDVARFYFQKEKLS